VSALRQQEGRAKLVRFFSHHCKEERLDASRLCGQYNRLPAGRRQAPVRRTSSHKPATAKVARYGAPFPESTTQNSRPKSHKEMRGLTSQNS
jgi:hypothetical protein